ncbi:MAG: LemA family protein [Clostridiales bacterium]|nr:LemA family protein [Clostridiales bacterium]
MSIQLDENNVNLEGKDVNVINQTITAKVGFGSKLFEVLLWVLFIIPGVIFLFKKIKADNYFQQLQQKIQKNASQIDNYMEQRVVVLKNCAKILDKQAEFEKGVFENIAKYRSGNGDNDDQKRNEVASQIEDLSKSINIAFENYPDLKSHEAFENAMRQNYQLQLEITAARELYNDTINTWNRDIFAWPTKMIVAAKHGYKTRIPFSISSSVKEEARGTFF